MAEPRTVILLAGPSGSGKSRLAATSGCPRLRLDDFYYDEDHPAMPRTLGIIDWDDPATWDAEAALRAIEQLCREGEAEVPVYSIAENRRTSWHDLVLGASGCFVAEGVFAPEMLARVQALGLPVRAVYLQRPRLLTFALRLKRDLKEHRKPPLVLVRRGLALLRAEPTLRRRAVAAGFEPLSMRAAQDVVTALA